MRHGDLAVLLAALGGAAVAFALIDLARSAPAVREYVASALRGLERAGESGDFPAEVERRRLAVLASAALALLVAAVIGPGVAAVIAGFGPLLAAKAIGMRRASYRSAVEEEIEVIAAGLAEAVGAGASLRQGLSGLPSSLDGPARVELARVREDIAIGLPPVTAMAAFAERIESESVAALVAAVGAQQRTGGDLPKLLRSHARAAATHREAVAEARSASAQARLTGGMVAALPFGALILVEVLAPGLIGSMLGEPIALVLLAVAVGSQLAGYLVISRLGRVGR